MANANTHLVIEVDWDSGTMTPIAAPDDEAAAQEAADDAAAKLDPNGDSVVYVLSAVSYTARAKAG